MSKGIIIPILDLTEHDQNISVAMKRVGEWREQCQLEADARVLELRGLCNHIWQHLPHCRMRPIWRCYLCGEEVRELPEGGRVVGLGGM